MERERRMGWSDVTSWGQEGKKDGAVSQRYRAGMSECPVHTTVGNAEPGMCVERLCLLLEEHVFSWPERRAQPGAETFSQTSREQSMVRPAEGILGDLKGFFQPTEFSDSV